jgi:hypothetical protein
LEYVVKARRSEESGPKSLFVLDSGSVRSRVLELRVRVIQISERHVRFDIILQNRSSELESILVLFT